VDLAFAEADGGVERSEAAETDGDGRHGRAGAEGAVFLLKDGGEVGGHSFRLQVTDDRLQWTVNSERWAAWNSEALTQLLH
jgi:hypothetical protein